MVRVTSRRAVIAAVGVLAAVGVVWLVVDLAPPSVDDELAASVVPAIDEELERAGPWTGLLTTECPELGPRWFCVEHVIEIQEAGSRLTVGVAALCEEYARDGDVLVIGSGEHAPKVVDLVAEGDGYRVTGVDTAPDGGARDWWLAHGFSEDGARYLERSGTSGESTAPEAREAFGLPSDAPVRPF
jgi:hypothetical protein